jgi:hypothetical protein
MYNHIYYIIFSIFISLLAKVKKLVFNRIQNLDNIRSYLIKYNVIVTSHKNHI